MSGNTLKIQSTVFGDHTFVKGPQDLWISRAPFTQIEWQAKALEAQQRKIPYGAVVSENVGGRLTHKILYFSTIEDLQRTFGSDHIKSDFGKNEERNGRREVVFKNDNSVAVFEFFALENVGMDRLTHPATGMTRTHAQGMCLFIGADLMDDETYQEVVRKSGGEHATPDGKLFGPNGEEYVHSSIKTAKSGTDDVNNAKRPDGPYGTRDYTGNVEKFMKETLEDRKLKRVGFRGGTWYYDFPEGFAASTRHDDDHPGFYYGNAGFVARRAQD